MDEEEEWLSDSHHRDREWMKKSGPVTHHRERQRETKRDKERDKERERERESV